MTDDHDDGLNRKERKDAKDDDGKLSRGAAEFAED